MKLQLLLIGLIISLLIFNCGCFNHNSNNNNDKKNEDGYTLLEMYNKILPSIEKMQLEYNNSISRIYMGNHIMNGRFLDFNFYFYDFTKPYNNFSTGINILIKNGKIDEININNFSTRQEYEYELDLDKIEIDSNDAYNIAIKNKKINDFLKQGSKYDVCMTDIFIDYDLKWYYSWHYDKGNDDPYDAVIYINAKTGEIMEGGYANGIGNIP